KPVNRDDIPNLRGIDGLKNGSPLGIEPKGEGISGASGFSTGSGTAAPAAGETPKKTPEPAPKPAEKKESTAPTGAAAKLTP
ncbi:MAG TPA: hypothetical protein VF075_07750, partial [Pyrinomonadaceae bacterium]